ncbi:MAG TPA: twin-arginine translocase subunit TatC [Thermodesulfobacteriota bacterium]|nr:twin-arginine translocase subunit TatC [Thermodesulfobacteriota bacterium]
MVDKKAPFASYLLEIRKRLILSFIAVGAGFLICYYFSDSIFEILTAPLINNIQNIHVESTLIFRSVAEAFFTYMKVGFVAGLMLASPFILYQIWGLVVSRLDQDKRRYVLLFVLGGSLFFALGILFGYFVALPFGCKFLLRYASNTIKPMPDMNEYLSFSVKFLLTFGLVFEFPILLLILARIGIVNAKMLAQKRRYAILLIFIFAFVISPPDLISQVLMALPLMGLYEVSILLCKIFAKGQAEILAANTK